MSRLGIFSACLTSTLLVLVLFCNALPGECYCKLWILLCGTRYVVDYGHLPNILTGSIIRRKRMTQEGRRRRQWVARRER